MSVTIKINHSSIELSCESIPLPNFDDEDSLHSFDINTYISTDIPNINIIIKNNYEYTLDSIDESIEINKISNKPYCYSKIFNLERNRPHMSTYIINKNNKTKTRCIIKYKKIYPICLYSYFIYNKYYSRYCNKNKIYSNVFIDIDTINEIKLFNCCDLYKIYSFI